MLSFAQTSLLVNTLPDYDQRGEKSRYECAGATPAPYIVVWDVAWLRHC